MKEYKKFELEKDGYTVKEASVCDIYDYFNVNPEYCAVSQQSTDASYSYGYTYVLICGGVRETYVVGSYVAIDRFYEKDNTVYKEMFLYEFSIFDQDDLEISRQQAGILYEYLLMHAEKTGCNRILFHANCANDGFNSFIADKNFITVGELCVLELGEVEMCDKDKMIVPHCGDVLPFRTLYYLRENHFAVTEDKCEFCANGHTISVDRNSGCVTFSPEISTELEDDFYLDGERALCIIDALRQAIQRVPFTKAVIYDERSENETFPDIIIDESWGIFVNKVKDKSLADRRLWLAALKKEGRISKYHIHHFHFDEEVGGSCVSIAPVPIR